MLINSTNWNLPGQEVGIEGHSSGQPLRKAALLSKGCSEQGSLDIYPQLHIFALSWVSEDQHRPLHLPPYLLTHS